MHKLIDAVGSTTLIALFSYGAKSTVNNLVFLITNDVLMCDKKCTIGRNYP